MVIGTPTVLNLIPGKVFPVVNVNQYDAGYQKTFLLYKGAEQFNVATDMAVTIRGTKGDKKGIADSVASTAGSNLVSVTLTEQMTAVAGPNIYELRIVDTNGLLVGTVNFVLMVEPAALGDDTVISDSDINYAADVLDKLQSVEAFKNQLDANTEDIVKYAFRGDGMTPVYIGDYLCDATHLPSCCLKIDRYFYAVDAQTRAEAVANKSNVGTIRKFDLDGNVEVTSWKKTANVGHANSIAFDGETIYIAPIWDTTSGAEVTVQYLYKFDSEFNALGTETIPTTAQAVTYDWKTGTFYYFDYSLNIYAKNTNGWELFTHLELGDIKESIVLIPGTSQDGTFNQDFAVNNGRFYLSSIRGSVLYGELKEGQSVPTGNYIVNYVDSTMRFHFGELEGMEFDPDGHLFAVDYSRLSANTVNAFIVELPVKDTITYSTNMRGAIFGYSDGTIILSNDTVNKFALSTYEIRSLEQFAVRQLLSQSHRVSIPSGSNIVESKVIRIINDIELYIAGTYECELFSVLNGHLSVRNAGGGLLRLTATSDLFSLDRVGRLSFPGTVAMQIDAPNLAENANFIGANTTNALVNVRILPVEINGKVLRKSGQPFIWTGLYVGNAPIGQFAYGAVPVPRGLVLPGLYYIDAGVGIIAFNITYHNLIPDFSSVSLTGLISVAGPNGAVLSFANLGNPSGFNVTVGKSLNNLMIALRLDSPLKDKDGNPIPSFTALTVTAVGTVTPTIEWVK